MKNTDIPAMPQSNRELVNAFMDVEGVAPNGLTRREYFAGLAMQGLLANGNDGGLSVSHSAMYAVEYADALLAVLEE